LDIEKPSLVKSKIDHIKSTRKLYQGNFATEDDEEIDEKSNKVRTPTHKSGNGKKIVNKLEYLMNNKDSFSAIMRPITTTVEISKEMDLMDMEMEDSSIENELYDYTQQELMPFNEKKKLDNEINLNKVMEQPSLTDQLNISYLAGGKLGTNTLTSHLNPAVKPFVNMNISTDLIETLKDPLQRHLQFGPSYSNGNENQHNSNQNNSYRRRGSRDMLHDRTNELEMGNNMIGVYGGQVNNMNKKKIFNTGYEMVGNSREAIKNKMFRNALDSVQLPGKIGGGSNSHMNAGIKGENNGITGISNFDDLDYLLN